MSLSSFVVIVHHRQVHTKIGKPVEESPKTGKITVRKIAGSKNKTKAV
jgi:hypothetical protein